MTIVVGIAGLTGKFAQCVAKELHAYPGVKLKGFCRSQQKLPQAALKMYDIEVVQGDFDNVAAVEKFVRGTNIVVCCYFGEPDLMIRGQKILVDACSKFDVPRFYLVEKGVAGVHVLVGALTETFWSEYFQVFDTKTQTIRYWETGDEKWELTTYETAAAYTAALVVDQNASGVFRFRGDCKSILEIRELYQRVYGSSLPLQRLGSLDELYHTVNREFEKDPNNAMAWAPGCFSYWCINGIAYLGEDLDNHKFPHIKPVDMESFLRAHEKERVPVAFLSLGF
ncbi:hypothetical protein BKA67DRAFT_516524 [Truncatella angustata]|uniref:NAD(P)-binding domain-containing protein n=1 Tax=Truncatella angustata TaxID=152316 RepID=A0A9P8UPP2_9PEZI|nr:uncharacterized protein BKA67DRAFT_516524 [Truncatella angustata]KAH6655947.1 hypothetical protein BKA67DRAFT_516524 [Truncatella angustata]